ncbi:hypothetical protein HW555_000621 [Spodoptera exigua]|uniref:Single domain-containing protein n=1 Tax=Spodoptera exigua TaxID=7107 RepID=A0A835GUC3_SPOEX|nr:hypothetical protein HW555_000621 [Spodoptera exigua]
MSSDFIHLHIYILVLAKAFMRHHSTKFSMRSCACVWPRDITFYVYYFYICVTINMCSLYNFLFVLCITVSIRTVFSAVALQLPEEKPKEMAHLEGCYVLALKRVLPYNTPFSPQDGGACLQFNCRRDNITSIFSCGTLHVGDNGCAIVSGDKYLPYPDCCDRGVCNSINHKSIVT